MQLQDLNSVLGVELKIIDDQLFSCRLCLVSKHKNALTIEHHKVVEGSLVAILADLPKAYPIALTLTGKGIIHKNVQVVEELTLQQLFQNIFPSIEQQNFYVQEFDQNQQGTISIIRKEVVDELLAKLKPAGLKIFTLSLGGVVSVPILAQLNSYDSEIQFDGHLFSLTAAKEWISYKYDATIKNKFPIKIGEEPIPEENIVAYAAAFQLLLHQQLVLIKADVTSVNTGFADFITNHKLKKKALIFLFSLFAALMVSFALFSYYNDNNAKLVQTVGAQSINEEQVDRMKRNIAEHEALLKQLNWNGGYNYGLLLNEVGESMPKQIRLLSLTMNEFKSEIERTERKPQLKIMGTTANLTAVNNWIFVLKEKPWVKTVNLLKYQEDPDTDQYQFNLILTY